MADPGPVEVQIFGTPELLAKMNRLGYILKSPRFRALLEDAGQAYVLLAQNDAPKASRLLKASIHHKVSGFGTDAVALSIGAGGHAAKYAYYVEVGTKPSVRFARQKRFMHWFQEGVKTVQVPYGMTGMRAYTASAYGGDSYSIFAKKVHHPGTRPQPFFFKHFPMIRERFVQALARLIQEDMAVTGEGQPT